MRGTRIALAGSITLLFVLGCTCGNPLKSFMGGEDDATLQLGVQDPTNPQQVGVQVNPGGVTVQGPDGQTVQVNGLTVSTTGGTQPGTVSVSTSGGVQVTDGTGTVSVSSGVGGVQVTDGTGTVSVSSGTGGVHVSDGTDSVTVGSDGTVTVRDGSGKTGVVKVKGKKKK